MVYRSALHPALLAQPQPRGSGNASCLQQTRIRTVCAGCCCLTDGLGLWPANSRFLGEGDLADSALHFQVNRGGGFSIRMVRVGGPAVGPAGGVVAGEATG